MKGVTIKDLLIDRITELHAIALTVTLVICDQGSTNVNLYVTMFGVNVATPYFDHGDNSILSMYDPPHQLKSVTISRKVASRLMNLKKSCFTVDESQEKVLHGWWISRKVASRLMNLKKSGFTVDESQEKWLHGWWISRKVASRLMNLKKSGFTVDESQEQWLHGWWISRKDASRLMNLKKSGFTVDEHNILWHHIRSFYDLDLSKPIRMTPRLTKNHLELCCGRIQQLSPSNRWGTVRGHGTGDWPATHHFGRESRPQETQAIKAPGSCKHERSQACAKTVCSWCVNTWSRLCKTGQFSF